MAQTASMKKYHIRQTVARRSDMNIFTKRQQARKQASGMGSSFASEYNR